MYVLVYLIIIYVICIANVGTVSNIPQITTYASILLLILIRCQFIF